MRDAASRDDQNDPVVRAYLDGIDVTLLRKNLALSVEARFRQLMELQRFASELRAAGSAAESR